MSTYNLNVPIITCPYCEEEVQIDDYYELGEGAMFDCPKCEKEIVVLETETQVIWTLGTQEESRLADEHRAASRQKAIEYTNRVLAAAKALKTGKD